MVLGQRLYQARNKGGRQPEHVFPLENRTATSDCTCRTATSNFASPQKYHLVAALGDIIGMLCVTNIMYIN